jgi:hypothetical protein
MRKTLQGSETEVPERIPNSNDRREKESVGPSFLFSNRRGWILREEHKNEKG